MFLRVRKPAGQDNRLYVHDVFVEDEIKAGPFQTRRDSEAIQSLRSTSLYKTILQDIYAADNSQVSKNIDENGEPLVVYHGTTRDFDTNGIQLFLFI